MFGKKNRVRSLCSPRLVVMTIACVCMLLGGCEMMGAAQTGDGSTVGVDGSMHPQPNFSQFKEIPIPEKAVMDLKKTMLFGNSPLVGRLAFSAPYNQSNVFDFYTQEMPKFGWNEITVIRAQNSVMTFSKENRVATVQLATTASGATDVIFDISFGKMGR